MITQKTAEEIAAEKLAKPAVDVVPPVFVLGAAEALGQGKSKHGVATSDGWGTWRVAGTEQALALTHYASLMRHLLDWRAGQETPDDSPLPNLFHAAAQLAILMDIVFRPPGSRGELDEDSR